MLHRGIGRAVAMLGLALGLGIPAASAQTYPSRPITLVTPFSPGSSADILARRVGEGLARQLGTNVVVENVTGAGGVLGTLRVQKAPADGYTLLIGSQGTHMMNVFLYKQLRYRPTEDFIPILNLVAFPNVLVVPQSLGVTTVKDLIALAKTRAAEGKPLNYGSGGIGTSAHLGAELLKLFAEIEMTHVAYKSAADTVADILSGRIDVVFGNIGVFGAFAQDGRLTPLAVTSPLRSPILPTVATLAEAGFAEAELSPWMGLFGVAGTPPDVVAAIGRAATATMEAPALKASYAAEGVAVLVPSEVDFPTFIRKDSEKWAPIIGRLGIPQQN